MLLWGENAAHAKRVLNCGVVLIATPYEWLIFEFDDQ